MYGRGVKDDRAPARPGPAAVGAVRPSAPPVVAVVGPTATGKSELGIALAHALGPAEIVSADAFQLYRGMDVGTAKVPRDARGGVPHHELDVLDVSEATSVARYQTAARADVHAIRARGARPIVVGGSGLYVRALLDRLDFPGTDPDLRARLERRAEREGTGALHAELAAADPVAAQSINPANARRIVRALEVIAVTGRPYSSSLPAYEYAVPAVQIGLTASYDRLDARIGARVGRMADAGLVEEALTLAPRLGETARRALGYAEVLDWVDAHGGLEQDPAPRPVGDALEAVLALIVQHTRRLARRQLGWFRRDPRIHWLDADSPRVLADALSIVRAADRAHDRVGNVDGSGHRTTK